MGHNSTCFENKNNLLCLAKVQCTGKGNATVPLQRVSRCCKKCFLSTKKISSLLHPQGISAPHFTIMKSSPAHSVSVKTRLAPNGQTREWPYGKLAAEGHEHMPRVQLVTARITVPNPQNLQLCQVTHRKFTVQTELRLITSWPHMRTASWIIQDNHSFSTVGEATGTGCDMAAWSTTVTFEVEEECRRFGKRQEMTLSSRLQTRT